MKMAMRLALFFGFATALLATPVSENSEAVQLRGSEGDMEKKADADQHAEAIMEGNASFTLHHNHSDDGERSDQMPSVDMDLAQIADLLYTSFNNQGDCRKGDENSFACLIVDNYKRQYPILNVMAIWNRARIVVGDYEERDIEMCSGAKTRGYMAIIGVRGKDSFTVTNTYEGGFVNWCYSGRCNRNGMTVHCY